MITKNQYEQFLSFITADLEDDWVVIGGSLLAILNAGTRNTTDIDICPLGELTNEKRLALMNLALKAGLSIESINPSADFFLRQIQNWKSSLVLFKSGPKGNIFRPSLELYLKLKLNRGSDSDILDCISFIEWHKNNLLLIDDKAIKILLENYELKKIQPILQAL
ncbi:MAG: hypothetical protein H7328_05685 [Bdellovibrio sp.]|nr:hypothetical protein [Bdellovibrio sp.]